MLRWSLNAWRLSCAGFMMGLWMSAGAAVAATTPYPLVVVFDMAGDSNKLEIPRSVTPLAEYFRIEDLVAILGGDAVTSLAYLGRPTVCEAGRPDCTEFRVTTDERLLETIQQLDAPRVLVGQPKAGVWIKDKVYYARMAVTLLETKPPYAQLRSFEVAYHESECDAACTKIAHRYAAEEFRDMIAYMLSVEPDSNPKALPPAWEEKPELKDVSRWANSCVKGVARDRLVRDDRDRAWLGQRSKASWPDITLSLASLSWTGCT